MRYRIVWLTLLAASLLATAPSLMPPGVGQAMTRQESVGLEIGQYFPDLELPDLDGTPRSIASYRGSKVILHVFASW